MNEKSGRVTSFVPFLEEVRKKRRSYAESSAASEADEPLPGRAGLRRRAIEPSARRVVQVLEGGPRPVTELASEAGLSTPDFMQALQRLLDDGAIRLKGAPGREDAELTDIGRSLAEAGRA